MSCASTLADVSTDAALVLCEGIVRQASAVFSLSMAGKDVAIIEIGCPDPIEVAICRFTRDTKRSFGARRGPSRSRTDVTIPAAAGSCSGGHKPTQWQGQASLTTSKATERGEQPSSTPVLLPVTVRVSLYSSGIMRRGEVGLSHCRRHNLDEHQQGPCKIWNAYALWKNVGVD